MLIFFVALIKLSDSNFVELCDWQISDTIKFDDNGQAINILFYVTFIVWWSMAIAILWLW